MLKMDAATTSSDINFVVNHLILPPKLPQEDEDLQVKINGELRILDLTTEAAKAFVNECGGDVQTGWISVLSALGNWNRVSSINSFHRETLEDLLINLKPQGQETNQKQTSDYTDSRRYGCNAYTQAKCRPNLSHGHQRVDYRRCV